jgi:hypothetical protein
MYYSIVIFSLYEQNYLLFHMVNYCVLLYYEGKPYSLMSILHAVGCVGHTRIGLLSVITFYMVAIGFRYR